MAPVTTTTTTAKKKKKNSAITAITAITTMKITVTFLRVKGHVLCAELSLDGPYG